VRGFGVGAVFVHGVQKGLAGNAAQFFLALAFDGGKGVEQELGDISEGHGVFAIGAPEGELPKEIAEQAVHVLSGGKLKHGAKKGLGVLHIRGVAV